MGIYEIIRKQALPKIVIGVLGLAIIVLGACSISGYIENEFMGFFSFGFLVYCVGVLISTALSLRTPVVLQKMIRGVWIATALITLLIGLIGVGASGDTFVTYSTVTLAFPVGIIVAPIIGTLIGGLTQTILGLTVFWLVIALTGYLQWFVLPTFVFRKRS